MPASWPAWSPARVATKAQRKLRRYLGCDDTDFHTYLGNDIWFVTEYEPPDVGEVLNCWQWGDEFHPEPDKALLCRCDVSDERYHWSSCPINIEHAQRRVTFFRSRRRQVDADSFTLEPVADVH